MSKQNAPVIVYIPEFLNQPGYFESTISTVNQKMRWIDVVQEKDLVPFLAWLTQLKCPHGVMTWIKDATAVSLHDNKSEITHCALHTFPKGELQVQYLSNYSELEKVLPGLLVAQESQIRLRSIVLPYASFQNEFSTRTGV